ncbi:YciI family protein [Mesobaculum littorinae]|uniref:YciI family protein n=1 Tax=Mesobaculum littorinae TaxID=2486419 RepID=A0A438AHB8_9RHOB|nr:YciI family protein [Mesobaculum littorinae]RVV97987.1 YciI family protein [Mesobaculum littorinae]
MHAAIICRDKPGSSELRKTTREAHLAYVEQSGVVKIGGPFLDPAGAMVGSLLILEVPDLAAAAAWAEADPYAQAGLFEEVSVIEWKQVIGA